MKVVIFINIILYQTNKNIPNPDIAKFEISDNEIKLLTEGPIAGIQLELAGEFDSKEISLPNGWEHYYNNGRLILINLKGPNNANPTTIFEFTGEISISSIITNTTVIMICILTTMKMTFFCT